MRHTVAGVAFLLVLGILGTGCGKKTPTLHVYTWSDYFNPEMIARFEREAGCQVVMDNFDSNEAMYAKLKAGATGYDLIVPSSYMVSIMSKQGMLQPIRHDLIPNIEQIDPKFLKLTEDAGMQHSVPYMISITGIGYDKTKVTGFEPSWAMFGRAEHAGRMTMLGDMREAIGAALKYLGYSLNTTDDAELDKAGEQLLQWKKNLAKFEVDEAKRGLGSGEFVLVQAYNGDALQVMEENDKIAFGIPKEGTSLASDDMVIPATAQQAELAHRFINFIHTPDVSAANMEHVSYISPNIEGQKLLGDELRNNPSVFPDPALFAKCEVVRDLGDDNRKYTRVWDRVKSGP